MSVIASASSGNRAAAPSPPCATTPRDGAYCQLRDCPAMVRTAAALLLCPILAAGLSARLANGQTPLLFTLSSPAFPDDGVLPAKYAGAQCRGAGWGGNISPPLAWSNAPAGTKSFAVLMIDPDGNRGLGSVHWVAYGIPAARSGLREGDGAAGSPSLVNGKNSRGTIAYTGRPAGRPRSRATAQGNRRPQPRPGEPRRALSARALAPTRVDGGRQRATHTSTFSAAMNASCGMSTLPNWRMRFLPSFCLSKSLRLRVTSPP
jgi:phosphatidylethanolamine-binding protein (PEBP) family uncharacterized protein